MHYNNLLRILSTKLWIKYIIKHCSAFVGYLFIMALINTLKAELNPICHMLVLSGGHHILHGSRIRVNKWKKEYITVKRQN